VNDYDVIVIGTGIAGGSIAAQCAAAASSTAAVCVAPHRQT